MMKPTETEISQMKDFARIFGKDSYLSVTADGCRVISTLAGTEGRTLIARYDFKRDKVENLTRTARDDGHRDLEYCEEIGECDHDCLMCSPLDRDCEGDDNWEYEMMIEEGTFGDEEDW